MYKLSIEKQNYVTILQFEVNFQALFTYFWKLLEKFRKYNTISPEIKKKIRKFGLKTAEYKKKIGSNVKKLRKLEPLQKQRVLIKKRV